MNEQIGEKAGLIWQALQSEDELAVWQLKEKLGTEGPLFDRAVGWLAREGKISLTVRNNVTRIRLK